MSEPDNIVELPDSSDSVLEWIPHRLPEGRYEVRVIGYATSKYNGDPRLTLRCEVTFPKQYEGIILPAYYPLKSLIGPPGKNGRFEVKPLGKFYRDYVNVLGRPERIGRISIRPLKGKAILAQVVTVKTDFEGKPRPEQLQYSKVEALEREIEPEDRGFYWR